MSFTLIRLRETDLGSFKKDGSRKIVQERSFKKDRFERLKQTQN